VGEPVDRQAVDSVDNEFRQGLFAYASNVVERMPSEDREALTLTELDGLSREELAKHLGISVSAAKSRVVRARAKLRKTIEECCRLITDPYGRVIGWRRRATACFGTTLEKV
jgi:RNA polymerase sigma-70 factor (ECF subfamily)